MTKTIDEDASIKFFKPDMAITFLINNKEILKICEDGGIEYQGRLIGNDKEILPALRKFLGLDKEDAND